MGYRTASGCGGETSVVKAPGGVAGTSLTPGDEIFCLTAISPLRRSEPRSSGRLQTAGSSKQPALSMQCRRWPALTPTMVSQWIVARSPDMSSCQACLTSPHETRRRCRQPPRMRVPTVSSAAEEVGARSSPRRPLTRRPSPEVAGSRQSHGAEPCRWLCRPRPAVERPRQHQDGEDRNERAQEQ